MNDHYKQYETQKAILTEYLQVMVALEKWTKVAEVAKDLAELDGNNKIQVN